MKRKRIKVLFGIFATVFMFTLALCVSNVKAEGEPEGTTTETTTVETVETTKKTEVAQKVEDYFGYIIGIPIGAVITTACDIIFLWKRRRQANKELVESKTQRKDLNKFISDTKEVQKEMSKAFVDYQEKFKKLDNALTQLNQVLLSYQEKNQELVESNQLTSVKVDKLIEIFTLVACHDEELVANGTAEKVNSLLNK